MCSILQTRLLALRISPIWGFSRTFTVKKDWRAGSVGIGQPGGVENTQNGNTVPELGAPVGFKEMGLQSHLWSKLPAMKFEHPSLIQAAAIPAMMRRLGWEASFSDIAIQDITGLFLCLFAKSYIKFVSFYLIQKRKRQNAGFFTSHSEQRRQLFPHFASSHHCTDQTACGTGLLLLKLSLLDDVRLYLCSPQKDFSCGICLGARWFKTAQTEPCRDSNSCVQG